MAGIASTEPVGTARRLRPWLPPARVVEPLLCVVAFLALVEVLALTDLIGDDNVLPTVDSTAKALWNDVVHGTILQATWITVRSWGLAMLIVIAVAIPAGLLLGASKIAFRSSHLTIEILRTVPSIAGIPFLVLLFGVTTKLVVVLVLLAGLWPLLLQTMDGVHDVDPVARETAKVYGLGPIRQFRQVVIPSALPYIATGLRLSSTIGLLLAIGTSMFAGGKGLGREIMFAQGNLQVPLLFARVFIAGVLGLVVYYALIAVERRALAWHPSYRKAS